MKERERERERGKIGAATTSFLGHAFKRARGLLWAPRTGLFARYDPRDALTCSRVSAKRAKNPGMLNARDLCY